MPAVRIESRQIFNDHLILGLESLVYTRSFGGHGTGAEENIGYLASFDLDRGVLNFYGPLFEPGDDIHWRAYFCNRQLTLLREGDELVSESPLDCAAELAIYESPGGYRVDSAPPLEASEATIAWFEKARSDTANFVGPNNGIYDRVTQDGRFYLPAFEASYWRGDPAQTIGPQGGEFRVLYDTFKIDGLTYQRAGHGFYFTRGETRPTLFAKRCLDPHGTDRAMPISIDGELRLLCLQEGILELRTPKGKMLASTPLDLDYISRMLHAPDRKSVYFTDHVSEEGLDVLRLLSWRYGDADAEMSETLIHYEAQFRQKLFGHAYAKPKGLIAIERDPASLTRARAAATTTKTTK